MKTNMNIIVYTIILLMLPVNLLAQEKQKKVETSEFEVQGVCGMCKERIENAALIKGVKLAEWNRETGMLKVVYKPAKVDFLKIHKSVANAGHETSKVKANLEAYNNLPSCCKYKDGSEKH